MQRFHIERDLIRRLAVYRSGSEILHGDKNDQGSLEEIADIARIEKVSARCSRCDPALGKR
jgi:hypothetical protein